MTVLTGIAASSRDRVHAEEAQRSQTVPDNSVSWLCISAVPGFVPGSDPAILGWAPELNYSPHAGQLMRMGFWPCQ